MKRRGNRPADVHADWLSPVEIEGPFLSRPVLKDMWPNGADRLGDSDDRLATFKQAFIQWQRAFDRYLEQPRTPESRGDYDVVRQAWIHVVLDDLAEWADLRSDADVTVRSPGEQIAVSATGALRGRDGDSAALLMVCEPTSGLRDPGLDGWAANDVDRLAMLLRKAQVEVGIVTDGQWWALVWAKDGKPTGSGIVNALTWAEEPLLRDAFLTLINQRRFRAADSAQRLTRLFERSELEGEEITETLGTQVRRSVELLVQAFSEARLQAASAGVVDPLAEKPDDVYQAAVMVMMRIVFLLFAEEREMLPSEQLYWDSYAIKDLLDELRAQAAGGEEILDESYDAWHRLLAVSQALHGGVNYDEMRMPAYGGSLLDPDRFPWLQATDSRGLRLKVSDRVMLHVLESVQTVVAKGERRRISFREIDVEQIGYIYEGLLGYSCAEVIDDIVLGLVGKDGAEPEIPLGTLNDLYDDSGGDSRTFATALVDWVKEHQPAATGKTAAALARLADLETAGDDRAELARLLTPVAGGDAKLLEELVGWGNLIRRDLRNIPLVFPVGGLVVVETPSRRNAGAHYTPRSLAEEVVLHALQPLVYEPGPLQTNDESAWRLKSAAAILDLKVADIAAGSGAFLVAAARYLAERLVEAWTAEDIVDAAVDADELRCRALREVIARCLYGADINPMAVEMCKLSLWLVSMDKTKPFSFVDDKIFCGNALLGLTSLDQLRYLHIDPKLNMQQQLLVDVDAKIGVATQLRHELASPVEERDPMRSSRAKARLLEQFGRATADLRLIADGIIATGLPLGGKPGRQLDDAYKTLAWHLHESFPADGSVGDRAKLLDRIALGLTPTVDTDYERWEPLHWVIEAPDIFLERGGFDALIGNPPFLVSKKISGAIGTESRDWLVEQVAQGRRGAADLVVFFLLRASVLVGHARGVVGLVTSKVVSEGDSRTMGLDHLMARGFKLFAAKRSEPWPARGPAAAAVRYSMVCGTFAGISAEHVALDGRSVPSITSQLEGPRRVSGTPVTLGSNKGRMALGVYVHGGGFVLTPQAAADLIADDSKNEDVLRQYLSGEDINSSPSCSASRWVIDFQDWSLEKAAGYPAVLKIVQELVKPKRDANNMRSRREYWWRYAVRASELHAAVQLARGAIAVTVVSKHGMPIRVNAGPLITSAVALVPWSGYATLGVMCSNIHGAWAWQWGSTMKTDLRYTPSDIFETFPQPSETAFLAEVGQVLDSERRQVMLRRQLGLTALYNAVNDPGLQRDRDLDRIRDIHVEADSATMAAYGWSDVPLDHGFYTYRQMQRWTVSPAARAEILDRLLELNHTRARAEGREVSGRNMSDGQESLLA